MKKTFIFIFSLMLAGFLTSGQATRLSLYEEFTGENCAPCASTNPGLNSLLNSQSNKIIAIKWQVPIPSAPLYTWSLYQTNKLEIDWRYQAGGYGYPTQNTPGAPITSGISSAPAGRIDGQHQWTFGATQDHPAVLNSVVISSAQAVSTPFSINMNAAWNGLFNSAIVSVTVQAASSFTSNGSLVFRLVLVERVINFTVAPGTNGEKDFEDVVRKSYPTIQNGTSLPSVWTAGQSQTFTLACASPSYIVSPYQQSFVGFIQDDGNKMVWQAARTQKPAVPNDIELTAVNVGLNCTPNFTPVINVINNGTTAITSLTMVPKIDAVTQTTYTWSGNIAGLASTTIALPGYTAAPGSHNFSVNISGVSGGDVILSNNKNYSIFGVINSFTSAPIVEPFAAAIFPPTNWMIQNYAVSTASITWVRNPSVGNAGAGSAQYDFYNNGFYGDVDDLVMPATNLTGVTNPMLSFDWAYSGYPTGIGSGVYQDRLDVKVSTDCGANWTTVFSKTGAQLQTTPSTTTAFTPSTNQWSTTSIPLPTAANQASVIVKFVAINDYGNFLYLDNVNLSQPASIKKHSENLISFDLYPNPANSSATLKSYSSAEQKATVTIYNTLGQMVSSFDATLSYGINEINLDLSNLNSGIYNVVLNSESGSMVKKLNISK